MGTAPQAELHVIDHPLVQHKLTQMRRKDTSSSAFRQLLTETSLLLAYEVTRELALDQVRIETPLVPMEAPQLVDVPVVVSILRAGNGLLEGVLQVLPDAASGMSASTAITTPSKPSSTTANSRPWLIVRSSWSIRCWPPVTRRPRHLIG